MQQVKITKTIIDHESATVHLYYDSAGAVVGSNLHAQLSEEEAPLDAPNYTNADIAQALADHLGIPVEQVTVAVKPEPVVEESIDE